MITQHKSPKLYWCFIFLLLGTITFYAQRPKVGLVLSGGGAKGISHIGILQAIDSAGLQIDFLTGTSMGSVVGSLYSIGYSGKQIEKEVEKLDWNQLLSNKPSYSDISIDEKDEYGKYSAEVGMKGLKPKIASGLIESQELWLKLNEMLMPVCHIKDFSKFNIPFRCISTDLSTGKAIVHSKGEIVSAVRASMAIPSVFTALDVDSTKLVDGGIIRNFPVTDVKEMGADIVIGVNLFPGLPDITKLNSALDVFYQITQYRDAEDLIKELKLCNVVIQPPVDQYSAGSFGSSDDIMKIGKEVGKLYYPYFKRLADSINSIQKIAYNPYNRLPKFNTVQINEIDVIGIQNTSRDLLLDKIDIVPNGMYTASKINQGFRRAYSTRNYDNVYYELIPIDSEAVKLKCIVKEALMLQAKAGLSIHSYSGLSVIANITARNLILKHSRTMFKAAIAEYYRILLQHRQAFGKKANDYFQLEALNENLPWNIYDKGQQIFLYKLNHTKFDFNYTHLININTALSLGTNFQDNHFKPDISFLNLQGNSSNLYTYFRLEYNNIDRLNFPTKGKTFLAEGGVVYKRQAHIKVHDSDGNSEDTSTLINNKPEFYKLKIIFNKYEPLHKKLSFFYSAQVGLTYHSQAFVFDNYFVGGIQPVFRQQLVFAGLNDGQINTSSAAIGQVGLQYNIIGDFLIIGRANTFLYDFIDESNPKWIVKSTVLNGFSMGLGYNLGLLPMEFNAMYAPELGVFYKHIKIGFIF